MTLLFQSSSSLISVQETSIQPLNPGVILEFIRQRASDDIPGTPECLDSSPFGTPLTIRELNLVSQRLQETSGSLNDIIFSMSVEKFIRGSIIQGTELIQARRDLYITLAETGHRLRRVKKNWRLQTGGVLAVEDGRHMAENSRISEIERAKGILQENIDRRLY